MQKKQGGGARRVGPKGGGAQKFAAFFSLSRHKIRSFLPSLGSSRGILVVFLKRQGAQMCTFGVLQKSTKGPQERDKRVKTVEREQKAKFWGVQRGIYAT